MINKVSLIYLAKHINVNIVFYLKMYDKILYSSISRNSDLINYKKFCFLLSEAFKATKKSTEVPYFIKINIKISIFFRDKNEASLKCHWRYQNVVNSVVFAQKQMRRGRRHFFADKFQFYVFHNSVLAESTLTHLM